MTTLGVIYLEFWTKNPKNVEKGFHTHLSVLKKFFMCFHEVGDCAKGLFVLLSIQNIDYQKKIQDGHGSQCWTILV
jgi:hypothetical protein